MTPIAYTVSTTIMYESKAQEWLNWLRNGHIDDVLKSGAESAKIIRLDPLDDNQRETTYEVHYIFPNRKIFEIYLEKHAPRLRAEGLEKFPLEDGFRYHRTIGEVLE